MSNRAPRPVRPKMLVVAGPPASGKTGVSVAAREPLDSFNMDFAARRSAASRGAPLLRAADTALAASDRFVRAHLAARRSYLVETTLDAGITLDLAMLARRAGFATQMIYITTNDAKVNVCRSLARRLAGGHDLDVDGIPRAYRRSLANLPRAVREFDAVLAYDNSTHNTDAVLQFQTSRGQLVRVHKRLEPWAEQVLIAVRLRPDS